jgi:hypothetical protein
MSDVLVSYRINGGTPDAWEVTPGRPLSLDDDKPIADSLYIIIFKIENGDVCFSIYTIAETRFHADQAHEQRRPVEKELEKLKNERDGLMAQVTEPAQFPDEFVAQCGKNAIQIQQLTQKLRYLPIGQPIACNLGTQFTAPINTKIVITFKGERIELFFECDEPDWSGDATSSFVCEPAVLDKARVVQQLRKQSFQSDSVLEATLFNSDSVWGKYNGDALFSDPKELPESVSLAQEECVEPAAKRLKM